MARVDVGLLFTARDRLTMPLRRLGAQFDKTQRKAIKLKASIKSIDLVIGAIILRKIIGVTSAFVRMGAEMEALRFRLGVFERSAEGADRVFAKLLSTFRDVPFDLKTIGDAFVRLRSAGLDPLDGSLKAIIDGVAAFGGGSQELQRTVIGIQQMAGKGVVSMEEMRQQIGEAMPFAMRVMADSMDISVTKLISQIERGELGAREGIAALVKGLEATVGGVAEGMVNTMGGAFEQLVKVVQEAAATIFTEFRVGDVIVLLLRELTSEIQSFVAGLDPQKVRDFVFGLKDIFITGVKVVKWLADFAAAAGSLVAGIVSTLGADASMLLAAGFIGLLMFGPPGALLAMAGVATVGIVREVKKMNKEISGTLNGGAGEGAGGGGGGGWGDTIVEEGNKALAGMKQTGAALTDASAQENAQLEAIRKAREETFKKIGTISSGAGLSVQSQKQVRFLETSIKSLKTKLEGTGPLPFLQQMKKFGQVADDAAKAFENDSKTIKLLQDDLAKFRETGDLAGIAQGEKDLKRALKEMEDARDKIKEQQGYASLWLTGKLDEAGKKVANKVNAITNDLSKRSAKLTGDIFGDASARAGIIKDFDEIDKKLTKELETATAIAKQDSERGGAVADINVQLARSNALRAQELQRVTEITAARKSLFAIEQRNILASATRDLGADLRALEAMANPIKAAFTPEVTAEARQIKEEIQGQVEGLQAQAAAIRLAGVENGGLNDGQREQIALLNERIGVLGQLKAATTETALLARDLWASVADTLKTGLGDALVSVVDGHKSAKDIINDMFRSITKAAADYIAQLVIMKALSGGLGGGLSGGMGGLFGGFFAKGGAFPGGVKAFANGDIIKGPTMFGLAGEAGTEAIMPLERVGGKLGVRSTGGDGGDTMNLTVQAIDQQSGAQFLLNNLSTIQGGIQNQKALNGTGR
jgi:tape measure domain-containing protein